MDESTWLDDPEAKKWAKHCLDTLVPMIDKCAISISIVPKGETDIKYAVELGLSIMLGKPILLCVPPGTQVPDKLVKIADAIVEFDFNDHERSMERMTKAISEMMEKLGLDHGND